MQTTVQSTLERAEDASTGGCGLKTHIQAHLEGALLTLDILGEEILTVDLLLPLINLIEAEQLQGAAGQEQTSSVASGPIFETEAAWKTVAHKLLGVGLRKNLVSLDGGVGDLSQDIPVGDANNHAILRRAGKVKINFSYRIHSEKVSNEKR